MRMNLLISPLSLCLLLLLLAHSVVPQGTDCPIQCEHDGRCVFGERDIDPSVLGDHPDPEAIKDILEYDKDKAAGAYCICPTGWTGHNCTVPQENCNDGQHPCYHGGVCSPPEAGNPASSTYVCDCREATDANGKRYVGKYCEYPEVIKCDSGLPGDFCVNGGQCNNTVPQGPCICNPGTTGDHCEFNAGSISENCMLNCRNGGECKHGFRDPTRPEGMLGMEFDPNVGGQHCECPPGYSGSHCQIKTEACDGALGVDEEAFCLHGGVCRSFTNPLTKEEKRHCDCTKANHDGSSWAGGFCQFEATSFCTKTPGLNGHPFCTNDGECTRQSNGIFTCDCPDGYTGKRCEIAPGDDVPSDYKTCTLDCGLFGECREGIKDHGYLVDHKDIMHIINTTSTAHTGEHCVCADGYGGEFCHIKTRVCPAGEHVCFHGSECVDDDTDAKCNCAKSDFAVAGEYCQHVATNICQSRDLGFCVNQGRCEVDNGKVTGNCICPEGFDGVHCEVNLSLAVETSPEMEDGDGDVDGYKIAFIVLCCALGAGALLGLIVFLTSRGAHKERTSMMRTAGTTLNGVVEEEGSFAGSAPTSTASSLPAQNKEIA